MIFSSLIFLWVFIPVVLLGYFLSKEAYRNVFLLIVSLFFYAWGEPVYVFVMIVSIVVNYYCGLGVGSDDEAKSKFSLTLGIIINLLLLGVFKYYNFAVDNVNALFGLSIEARKLALPIGISFYTFQSISYLIDIKKGVTKPQENMLKMGLFISFFPQLVAGPILKYHEFAPQMDKREVTWKGFNEGAIRFIQGLGKKVIIANIMAKTADDIFALGIDDVSTLTAWIGIIAYTLQIYFDFSGYSEMAIGLGKMFGFKIPENFNYPYISTSIKEFWRRWHISLSTWFKEYLYIPLGGNRKGTFNTYRNLMIVFFTTGLWHGASWNFVIWGVFHGFFLVMERLVPVEKILRFRVVQWLYAMMVVIVGWVFFRVEQFSDALMYLNRMFVPYKIDEYSEYLTREFSIVAVLGFVFCGVIANIYQKLPIKEEWKNGAVAIVKPAFLVGVAYLAVLMLASNTYNPFIYFRF
ncbi:MAG: MBOAT family protein [Lactobacillus sp.]|jgi:alginate O-acetyltransferase complex protein AlgI|nr:MBOAT family protein [Lactobacillus sp.]